MAHRTAGLILVVEDDATIASVVSEFLESRGFEVDYARDGLEALRLAADTSYDAIILDRNLPRLEGTQVCERLRREHQRRIPVLMLTGCDTLDDKLVGLDAGADDYLTKPFAMREVEARLRALIRRERREVTAAQLQIGELTLDPASMSATRAGQPLKLSPTGFQLLSILMRESPRVVRRADIEREIWGNAVPDSDTLRTQMYLLRKQLDKPFAHPLLHTMQSAGYRLADLSEPVAA